MDGRPDHHLELTETLFQHVKGLNGPPVSLLLAGPRPPGCAPHPIPWQADDPNAVRVYVGLSMVPDWAVDLTPFRDEALRVRTPFPHLYTYPPLSLRLCCPAAPKHSDALTAADFEQGTLW